MILERLEDRQLMAVGPQLAGIQPNVGELLENGQVLQTAPNELRFHFSGPADIDATSLSAIQVTRSGFDGTFERASVYTDFNTNGAVVVRFSATQPGTGGNDISLLVRKRDLGAGAAPSITVDQKTITIELNTTAGSITRATDLVAAINSHLAARELITASLQSGSATQDITSPSITYSPLNLGGANAAKASTSFNTNTPLDVLFTAANAGVDGNGTKIVFTKRDRGFQGPRFTVSGKTLTVELNTNASNRTTAQGLVDALNRDPAASALVVAAVRAGNPNADIASPNLIAPLVLTGANDIAIVPGFLGLDDNQRQVVMRFAEPLPDDLYRVEILGSGPRALRDVDGSLFNDTTDDTVSFGKDFGLEFDLDLGAQIVSVVPQPVTRDPVSGVLVQNRNQIVVYFNNDDLLTRNNFFGVPLDTSAEHPSFYQLIFSNGTVENTDDFVVNPTLVTYNAATDRAVLTFGQNLESLINPATGLPVGTGTYRLRVGTAEPMPLVPNRQTPATDPGSSFATATNLATLGLQNQIIAAAIEAQPYGLQFPGDEREPGHRDLPEEVQRHYDLPPDATDGITTQFYNFQNQYGTDPSGNVLQNAITDEQKQRAREVFDIYAKYLGIQFVESQNLGITIATGDMRAIDPNVVTGPGNVLGLYDRDLNPELVVLDAAENWFDGFGLPDDPNQTSWFQIAMREIGVRLGMGKTDELPPLTVQNSNPNLQFDNPVEPVFPGNADIFHGQNLYRPESKDIDLYRFAVTETGLFTAEVFAERLSNSSLLDANLRLYREIVDGNGVVQGRELVAQNDDYFSRDSFLELNLTAGTYYIGVSASGNEAYDPVIADSGLGGTTQGPYELRLGFRAQADRSIVDNPLDMVVNKAGAKFVDGQVLEVFDSANQFQRFEIDKNSSQKEFGTRLVTIRDDYSPTQVAEALAQSINTSALGVRATVVGTRLSLTNKSPNNAVRLSPGFIGIVANPQPVAFDGDADGVPGGVFNYWFNVAASNPGTPRTLFVDKAAANANGTGSIGAPYKNIDDAIAAARPGDIVRIVANGGADKNLTTLDDNLAYEIGFNAFGTVMTDGPSLEVPRDVTVMIDAGAIIKARRSAITVGSSSTTVNRSGSSLQVLGVPRLLDASGNVILDETGQPALGSVIFTSLHDTIGVDTDPNQFPPTATTGDWGGIVFRNDIDRQQRRTDLEAEGLFLNWVNHADFRFGGGNVVADGLAQVVSPIYITDARPSISHNIIAQNAGAAMSASPNSFEETNFHAPPYQFVAFTSDYTRVGPDIHGNHLTRKLKDGTIVRNSNNGLFVRVRTPAGNQTQPLTVSGRWDETDIPILLTENLTVQGSPGGPVLESQTPPVAIVTLQASAGGTLDAGTFNYKVTFVDANGNESLASEATRSLTLPAGSANRTITLRNLPTAPTGFVARRVYRSAVNGLGPYTRIAELNASDVTFVDNGRTRGGVLVDLPAKQRARQDGRLAVDPGVVVKLDSARIETAMGGRVLAEGVQGRNVVFTSLLDDRYGGGGTFDTNADDGANETAPMAGDWSGLFVGQMGGASLDHAVLSYAGGVSTISGTFTGFNPIEIHQAEARIAHSTIEKNADGLGGVTPTNPPSNRLGRGFNEAAAIFVRGSQPVIVDNVIRDNKGPAISINANSLDFQLVTDAGRSVYGKNMTAGRSNLLGRDLSTPDNQGPLVRANRLDNNDTNGMEVRGETLSTQGIWDDTDIVHVLHDTVYVPDFHTYGGLRLKSRPQESLVVKLKSLNTADPTVPLAGFRALGQSLDIDDRIGGSVALVGQPDAPVILTSIIDDSVGAGFKPNGEPQNNTDNVNTGGGNGLPTGPEVNNGITIDNDVATTIPGSFEATPQAGGSLQFFGSSQVTAQGLTQLFTNQSWIFEFLNYVDVGSDGNAVDLGSTTITMPPTLVSDDLVVSEGNFNGPNGQINWHAEGRFDDGVPIYFNTITFSSAAAFGNVRFINYLDEDVQGISDDLLVVQGTPGAANFRALTIDGPERIGFSQGGIYTAGPGLVSATYDGWAADEYSELRTAITGSGTTYSVPGNIDTAVSLPPFVDPTLGTVYGPNDITTAFAWTLSPTATSATITSFLELIPRDPSQRISGGEWKSIDLQQNSNDRNVDSITEQEGSASTKDPNGQASGAQFLGALAQSTLGGDDVLRLGFDLQGNISHPSDVDVYSFDATAGTEVWFDIDRTSTALDSVVELVDADGNVIVRSDNSTAEATNRNLLYPNAATPANEVRLPLNHVNPLQKTAFEPFDRWTTNPRDAGLRVVLPGNAGTTNTFYVRVRSSSPNLANVKGGLTRGVYNLQVRLQEVDEIPGSTINYADLRYATNGIEVHGLPQHSPLLGEARESSNANDLSTSAQPLGNLLQSDRAAISVGGDFTATDTVDWYTFDVDYNSVQDTSGIKHAGVSFDVDYADGLGRANTSVWVFDDQGRLILAGRDSNIAEDQPAPRNGLDGDDLTRGSMGTQDPYIGTVTLPAASQTVTGAYAVAITPNSQIPQELAQFTQANVPIADAAVRLEPVNSVQRIADDQIGKSGQSNIPTPPTVPVLFDDRSVVPFHLGDVPLLVTSVDDPVNPNNLSRVHVVNPFTGGVQNTVGIYPQHLEDWMLRPDGRISGYQITDGATPTDANSENYITVDVGSAVTTNLSGAVAPGAHGILTFMLDPMNQVVAADAGFLVDALTIGDFGSATADGLLVGHRGDQTPPLGVAITRNVLYRFNPTTGAATSAPQANRTGAARVQVAGTQIVERGVLATDFDPYISTGAANSLRAAPATLVNSITNVATFNITDGSTTAANLTSFAVDEDGDSVTPPIVFEFNSGPEVRFVHDEPNGIYVRDGDTFTLDGTTYEFDTGSVLNVIAANGTALQDGTTITITDNATPQISRTFEFDSGGGVTAGNVAVPFVNAAAFTRQQITTQVVNAINAVPGFAVNAQQSAQAGTFRVTLFNESNASGATTTSTGIQIIGAPGGSAANLIPVEEVFTTIEFGTAVDAAINGPTVDASAAGNRLNFSGAIAGTFTNLVGRNVVSAVLNSDGLVTPGRVGVPFLAADTGAAIATRIVQALATQNITASSTNEVVTLASPARFDSADAPLFFGAAAPGGDISGLATMADGRVFAVTGTGGLFELVNSLFVPLGPAIRAPFDITSTSNQADYVETASDLLIGEVDALGQPTGGPIRFVALTAGPANVEGGTLADVLFGLDVNARLYAFGTDGKLAPVFVDGRTSVPTGLTGATGIAFSKLDENLWHISDRRQTDAGHGVVTSFDGSRTDEATAENQSLYFGYENQQEQPQFGTGVLAPTFTNSINFTGGAHGTLISRPFSLKGVSDKDLPTLYFNYRLATENASGSLAANAALMRDSLRVFVADDDGKWKLLSTNNSNVTAGDFNDEFDPFGAVNREQPFQRGEAYDVGDNGAPAAWRQARIDLGPYAGRDNLRLRIDFSTAGAMGLGAQDDRDVDLTGTELRALSADKLRDGDTFTLDGNVVFEFDLGPTISAPTGAAIVDGQTFNVDATTYEFDSNGVVAGTNRRVAYLPSDSGSDIAASIDRAVRIGNPAVFPSRKGERLTLSGANTVQHTGLPANFVEGRAGVTQGNKPINIDADMTSIEVADAIATAMAEQFAFVVGGGGGVKGDVQEAEPNNTLAGAMNLDGADWSLNANVNIGDQSNNTSTSIPHVTISGTGDGTFDVYKFTIANAGDRGIFDIDGGTTGGFMNSRIRLLDASGSVLATNDDSSASFGQGGSLSTLDSFLSFPFTAAGTYYLEVGETGNVPIRAGADYQLQVSIENHVLGSATFVAKDAGGLKSPTGLTFGPDGNLYVASDDHTILRYNGTNGAFLNLFVPQGSGGLNDPYMIAFGPDDNLYVASTGNSSVLKFNGQTGAFMGGFPGANSVTGIAFDAAGLLYATSRVSGTTSEIRVFDPATNTARGVFVTAGSGGLGDPRGIAFGPDGNLYVADGLTRSIHRYNGSTGRYIDDFVPFGRGINDPQGIVFGRDGNLLVAEASNSSVIRFDGTTGQVVDTFIPPGNGGLVYPTGIVFGSGPNGDLFVSNRDDNSVLRYDGFVGQGSRTAVKTFEDIIKVIGHEVTTPGPLGYAGTLFGDQFGSFTSSTLDDGTTDADNPGALMLRNNAVEGVYLDDFIIGFAERGEMVTRPANNVGTTAFVNNPLQPRNDINIGTYQLEIRRSADYGISDVGDAPDTTVPTLCLRPGPGCVTVLPGRTFNTNDRLGQQQQVIAPFGSDIKDGQTFVISDGVNQVTFEFRQLGVGVNRVTPGNVQISFDPTDDDVTIAQRIRDGINAANTIGALSVTAATADTNRENAPSTSNIVNVFGAGIVTVGATASSTLTADLITTEATLGNDRTGNDVLVKAVNSGILAQSPTPFRASGSIGDNNGLNNRATDVDLLRVQLAAGDRITIDIDAALIGSQVDTILRIFDATGTPLALNNDGQAPGEPGSADSYLDFTAPAAGTYYIGVSSFDNRTYNPQVAESGLGLSTGNYQIEILHPQTDSQLVSRTFDEIGDGNRERDQGQVVIQNSSIRGASEFGIRLEAGTRDASGAPHFGPARNLVVANSQNLAPGVTVKNNVLFRNNTGGIRIAGETNAPGDQVASVPFARIVNNTIFGSESSPVGIGIQVGPNASPTILNNILSNLATGVEVDFTSTSTVLGGTIYHGSPAPTNTGIGVGALPLTLDNNATLFVDMTVDNFYLAKGSRAIDSAIDSLNDRNTLTSVRSPLGIPPSPILAPDHDAKGQTRVDDPTVASLPGVGQNVFKDRGAIDRADFAGPSAVLVNPPDNDAAGADVDPRITFVEVPSATVNNFTIHLADQLQPTGLGGGSGADDAAALGDTVKLFRDGQKLTQGVDYDFFYDATNNIIRLTPLAGIFSPKSHYVIRLLNQAGVVVGTADSGDLIPDGSQFDVTASENGQTATFEFESGYSLQIPQAFTLVVPPQAGSRSGGILDGDTFQVSDGTKTVTFEFDTNNILGAGNVRIAFTLGSTVDQIATAIIAALRNGNLGLDPINLGNGKIHLGSLPNHTANVPKGALTLVGRAASVTDGMTFSVDDGTKLVTFEFNRTGGVATGNTPISFTARETHEQIAGKVVAALVAGRFGLTPTHLGDGFIHIGGETRHVIALTNAASLTLNGQPGVRPVLGVKIPTTGGKPVNIADGESFSIDNGVGGVTTFEFDSNNIATPGNIPVRFTVNAQGQIISTTDQIANNIVTAIRGVNTGLTPVNAGFGVVNLLNSTVTHSLNLSLSRLTQLGSPGVAPAIPIVYVNHSSFTAAMVAQAMVTEINRAGLPGVTATAASSLSADLIGTEGAAGSPAGNDTLATAITTGVLPNSLTAFRANGEIGDNLGLATRASDVDMVKLQLSAGERVLIDVDAALRGSSLNAVLRVFDGFGIQAAINNDGVAPNEPATVDPYLDFTAPSDGVYFIAVSSAPNLAYDPLVAGSGTGTTTGAYQLEILHPNSLTQGDGDIEITGTSGVTGLTTIFTPGLRDLAGNALQSNQVNGATEFTVFIGGGFDYGDAPLRYLATFDNENGAKHQIVPGFFLGARVDSDADGQPSDDATADDLDNALDDEDGVTFDTLLVRGYNATITVTAAGITADRRGFVDAWIDFNGNGNWNDAGEQILDTRALANGANVLTIPIPAGATLGTTYARFRYSSSGNLSPTGFALDGEVEDYQVRVENNPWQNTTEPRDVNADGLISPIDALQVINFLNFNGAQPLPNPPPFVGSNGLPVSPPPFLDVNGDRFVTAGDALMVINRLVQVLAGQGEPADTFVATPQFVLPPEMPEIADSIAPLSSEYARPLPLVAPVAAPMASRSGSSSLDDLLTDLARDTDRDDDFATATDQLFAEMDELAG